MKDLTLFKYLREFSVVMIFCQFWLGLLAETSEHWLLYFTAVAASYSIFLLKTWDKKLPKIVPHLPLLAFVPALLLCRTISAWVICGAMLLITVVIDLTNRIDEEYGDVYKMLTRGMVMSLMMFVLIYMVNGYDTAAVSILSCLAVFMICSIGAMRVLRHDEGSRKNQKLRKDNFVMIISVTAVSVLLGSEPVVRALTVAAKAVYAVISRWLGLAVYALVGFFGKYIDAFVRWVQERFSELAEKNGSNLQINMNQPTIEDILGEQEEFVANLQNSEILVGILFAFLIFLTVLIVWSIFKNYAMSRDKSDIYEDVRESLRQADARGKGEKLSRKTPIGAVRYRYRKFLELCIRTNVELEKTDTATMIRNKANSSMSTDTEKVRQVYAEARYGGRADSTSVKEMDDELKRIKKDLKKFK